MSKYIRTPLEFKKYPSPRITQSPVKEGMEKHRDLKHQIMALLEKANTPNMSKEKMKDDLFRIYLQFK